MKRFDDQNHPFAAKVYFFNSDEIRSIIKSLIGRYFKAMGRGNADDDENDNGEGEGEDFSEKHNVLQAMMPIFCDQPEFQSNESATRYLETLQSEDDEMMLDQLCNWADNVKDAHLKSNDFVLVAASTADQLIGSLQPYTCTVDDEYGHGLTSPWPLVRMIDFGLNIPILNGGVILVDSPGISDANTIRAANAKSQHQKCSHKIHVAQVGRARDDKSIRQAMADTYKWRGSQNSILVLTCGDVVDQETRVIGSELSKRMEKSLKDQVKELMLRKDNLTSNFKTACIEERFAIDEELESFRPKLHKLSLELDACRAKMRNEHTKFSIQRSYKQMTGDRRLLPVHVVANEAWSTHQTGYYENDAPIFSVEETGLPALRTKLYEMPAEGKLNDILHLAEHQLPRLINSFEAYCSRTHIARKGEIQEIILQPKKEWAGIQQRTIEKLKEEVQRTILQPMKDDEEQWNRKARRLCKEWGTKYYKKNLYLLKNEGFQTGRKKTDKPIDWNTELIAINKTDLEECFKELDPLLKPCYDQMWEEFKGTLDTTKKSLRRKKPDPNFDRQLLTLHR